MVNASTRMTVSCIAFAAGAMLVCFAAYRADLGDFVMVVSGAMMLADWLPS